MTRVVFDSNTVVSALLFRGELSWLPEHWRSDPERDLEPVTLILSSPMVLLVHPSTPIKSVRDLVRVAKSRPNGLTYASAGVGNFQHLSMELFQSLAGIKMVHVPYKGAAPAGTPKDLIAAINRDFVWALTLPETRQRLTEQGAEVVAGGPAELAAFVRRESAVLAKIIKTAGIPQE